MKKHRNRERKLLEELAEKPVAVTSDRMLAIASSLFERLDTPTSLGLALCIKHGDLRSLCSHSVDPHKYDDLDVDAFAVDYQCTKLLAKNNFLELNVDKARIARDTFLACEKACGDINDLFSKESRGLLRFSPEREHLLIKVSEIIESTLGSLDVEDVLAYSRLGPGLTAFGPANKQYCYKLTECVTVTEELWNTSETVPVNGSLQAVQSGFAEAITAEFQGWFAHLHKPVKVVRGGKFSTVPKDAFKDRCIETQPTINVFLQLGLGRCMRDRLRGIGIDLSDQSANQRLALEGSVTGKLATIDLSNASDTIARAVVRRVFPPVWLCIMDRLRTRQIYFDGEWRPLERYSSMGNGFTFELESMLFYAICRAVCGPKAIVSVYGDDIIVPTKYFQSVLSALTFFGFAANPKKSFGYTTSFRESCGKDYFMGVNVRPHFIKELPLDVPKVIRLANGLTRTACRWARNWALDRRLMGTVHQVKRLIPPSLRKVLAWGWSDEDEILLSYRKRDGYRVLLLEPQTVCERFSLAVPEMLYHQHTRDSEGYTYERTLGPIIVGPWLSEMRMLSGSGHFRLTGGGERLAVRLRSFSPEKEERYWGRVPSAPMLELWM